MVTVRYYATLRSITKVKEERVEDVSEVSDLLSKLVDRYGQDFRKQLYDGESLYRNVIILVNGNNITALAGMHTKLSAEDKVDIFPPVAGG